jgi:hypothetical protein
LQVFKKDNLILNNIDISNSEDDYTTNINFSDLSQTSSNSLDANAQNDYHNFVGGISFVNNNTNDVMIDTYGSTHKPNSLVFGNASGQNIDGNGFTVTLDAVGEGFYQYITIGSEYGTKNYGTAHARKLTFSLSAADQYKINNNIQSSTTLQSIRSNNVASFIIQYYDNSSFSWVDASDNDLFFTTSSNVSYVTFNNPTATQFRLKVQMLSVSVSNFEKIKLTVSSASLNIHTRPETGTQMHRLKKLSSNNSANEGRVEFDDVISSDHLNQENMLSFKIAITNGSGNLTGLRIGINDSSSNTNNMKSFTLNSSFISSNKNKGWIEVQAPFADFIDYEGTPSLIDCTHLKIYLLASSTSAEAEILIDDFNVVKDERGTWDGDYKFFYSWIYDRTQESSFFEFNNQGNGLSLTNNRLSVQSFIRELNAGGFSNGSTRITGANVYFAEFDNDLGSLKYDDPFLLINVDFEKGISDPFLDSMQFWSTNGNHKTHNILEFIDPPFTTNFSINSGYTYNFNNHIEKIRFRDATVMNRRIYYGNVDVVYEKRKGETYPLREKYCDRVYKSLANRPDVVPSYNYIDILVNDGDEITALESYADRLLVFKNNSMLLVNATKDVEFLEDNYQYKGVWNYAAIDKVPSGIAWANSFGAYYYDGEKIVELSDKKIDQTEWATSIGSKPTVVYEPKERHLIVASTNSDDGWVCDLDTMAWTKLVDFKDSNTTNIVFYDNNLTYGVYTSSLAFSKLVYDKTAGANSKFSIITRDIDFGSSGTFIDFKKLYVTYKGTATNLTIQYRKNGSVSNNSLVGSFSTSLTGLSTVSFVPTDKSIAKNLHSLQFVLNSAQVSLPNNIEIHDMSIVYRGKKIK